jgi:hypothetical protein
MSVAVPSAARSTRRISSGVYVAISACAFGAFLIAAATLCPSSRRSTP